MLACPQWEYPLLQRNQVVGEQKSFAGLREGGLNSGTCWTFEHNQTWKPGKHDSLAAHRLAIKGPDYAPGRSADRNVDFIGHLIFLSEEQQIF